MATLIPLMVLFVSTACAAEIIVPMPRGTYRFPIEFRTPENATVDGSAVLSLSLTDSRIMSSLRGQIGNSIEVASYGFVGTDDGLRFEFIHHTRVRNDPGTLLEFAATRDSVFGQSLNSGFLITPSNTNEDLLVINPTDPADYAYERSIYYTQSVNDRYWGMTTVIRGQTSSTGMECRVDLTGRLILPWRIANEIIDRIESLGLCLPIHNSFSTVTLYGATDEIIEQLPTVELLIDSEDGTRVQIGVLSPHDYIIPQPGTRYHSTAFYYDPFGMVDRCQLNHDALKSILIHFDAQNNRIGFGDPIVEL